MKNIMNSPPEEENSKLRLWLRETPTWVEIAALLLAIAAIAIPLTVAGGSSSSSQGGPADLAVDVFSVRDFAQGPHPNPHLEVILHNRGGTRAVVDGAIVEVEDVYAVRRCASQNDIPLSETYGLVLPHSAKPSEVREVPLHDEVGPDGVDRFAISVSTRLSAQSPATYFLFRLRVKLKNDGPDSPLLIGTALISLPTVPDQGEYYWTPMTVQLLRGFETEGRTAVEFWGESMPCWRKNTAVLRRALQPAAVRSAKLDAISKELVSPSFAKLE